MTANYAGIRSRNGFTYVFGKRRPNGECCLQDPLNEFANLLLSQDEEGLVRRPVSHRRSTVRRAVGHAARLHAGQIGGDRRRSLQPRLCHRRRPTRGTRRRPTNAIAWSAPASSACRYDFIVSGFLTLSSGLGFTVTDASRGFGVWQSSGPALHRPARSQAGVSDAGFEGREAVPVGEHAAVLDRGRGLQHLQLHQRCPRTSGFIPPLPEINPISASARA